MSESFKFLNSSFYRTGWKHSRLYYSICITIKHCSKGMCASFLRFCWYRHWYCWRFSASTRKFVWKKSIITIFCFLKKTLLRFENDAPLKVILLYIVSTARFLKQRNLSNNLVHGLTIFKCLPICLQRCKQKSESIKLWEGAELMIRWLRFDEISFILHSNMSASTNAIVKL